MSTINLKFRIATPNDAPGIQNLVQSAFRSEDSRPDWTADMKLGASYSISVEEIENQITKPDSATLLALDANDMLVASVAISKRGNLARLANVVVDPSQQQGGIGRRLLEHAEDYGRREWGARKFGLNALSTREQLILWYTRRGYEKTGEVSAFPVEKFRNLDLPDDLCFVEMEKTLTAFPVVSAIA
ncbi:Acyl-CoA N-acyltransferases (Nat) [Glarea lozoyensis ATCC 20868]|uniref:Acyl-CoA N-acyltransferases (Nat) n=1 Tax=Glarea lozoyensis (strain ATCC 20868 / MF5171) TaxID=1116229 RepID=S3CIJ2_GLAL2|nr:Acyl-CoA N-acyltransferases (Nat) [Glarea lozoyensis ATCC 20868]EPE26282.1 Acyl-CoA N-acyltransferases (Nat) [Glarea lozoyensis ATCC 20868]